MKSTSQTNHTEYVYIQLCPGLRSKQLQTMNKRKVIEQITNAKKASVHLFEFLRSEYLQRETCFIEHSMCTIATTFYSNYCGYSLASKVLQLRELCISHQKRIILTSGTSIYFAQFEATVCT